MWPDPVRSRHSTHATGGGFSVPYLWPLYSERRNIILGKSSFWIQDSMEWKTGNVCDGGGPCRTSPLLWNPAFPGDRAVGEGIESRFFSRNPLSYAPMETPATPARKPEWLKVRFPSGEGYRTTLETARKKKLHTVCEEAHCPNIAECWGRKTATFMILGDTCTRACKFCAVKTGRPPFLDTEEPIRTAVAVRDLGIRHAVITSVNRDELKDGGAGIFAETVRQIRKHSPETRIEVLTPDFLGKREALELMWDSRPDVFGHNIEVVPRLQKKIRSAANYERSIMVLEETKKAGGMLIKTGLQLGHGESWDEILEVIDDMVRIGLDVFTIGQYLQPTKKHLPVRKYYTPDEFELLRKESLRRGIPWCQSGPLVRSSYRAEEPFEAL